MLLGGGGGVGGGVGKPGCCVAAWLEEGVSTASAKAGAKASGAILDDRDGRQNFQEQNAIKPTTSNVMKTMTTTRMTFGPESVSLHSLEDVHTPLLQQPEMQ